jgi:hypothetical protein
MNKKSFILYLSTLLIFSLLVFVKQRSIIKKNQKEPVTFYSAWKTDGKPVVIKEAQKSVIENILKMTIEKESEGIFVGLLPKGSLEALSLETPVFIDSKGKKILCKILEIGSLKQFDSGMYPIKVRCEENLEGSRFVAEVSTKGLKKVVLLPHDSVNLENKESFVWMVKEGKAHKQAVTLEEKNSQGIVAKGIEEKDLIVIEGSSALNENDPVKIKYEN